MLHRRNLDGVFSLARDGDLQPVSETTTGKPELTEARRSLKKSFISSI